MDTQPPPPARIALANRVLDAMDFDHTSDRMAAARLPASASRESHAGLAGVQEFAKKYFTPHNMRPAIVHAYATRFSDDELTQLALFHESPVARKMRDLQPEFSAISQQVMAQVIQEHMDEYLEIMGRM